MDNKPIMLVVDDIEGNREVMSVCFCEEYNIIYACDGLDAIEKIKKYGNEITVILLDIIMPRMDGIEVLKWISNSEYCYIPVIAITSETEYQLEALQNGACDFIGKPIENRIIQARVSNVLGHYALKKQKLMNDYLKKTKLEMDNLVNSIPGGIARFRLTDRFEVIYYSDGVADISGHTREECDQIFQKNVLNLVYNKDKQRLYNDAVETLKSGKSIEESFRRCHKNGGLVWININAICIGQEDGAYIIHAVFQKPSKMAILYDNLVNETKNAIYVNDANNFDLLYINAKGRQMAKKNTEIYSGKKCYEFLFNRTEPCPFCKISNMNSTKYLERDFVMPNSDRIFSLKGKLTNWNGILAHVEYVDDVTDSRLASRQAKELTNRLVSVIENIPGGMCVYSVENNIIRPIVHNQAFFNIFGYDRENAESVKSETTFLNVHKDDVEELKLKMDKAIKNSSPINHTYRIFNDTKGAYIWINLNGIVVNQLDGTKCCYVSYTDITEERKVQEELLQAQEQMESLRLNAEDALQSYRELVNTVPGGIALYEIEGEKVITKFYSDGLCTLSGYTRAEREAICAEDAMALTYEEDKELLYIALRDALKYGKNVDITYRINTKSGKPKWVHLVASNTKERDGKPSFHAVFSDMDEQKRIEQKSKELQLRYEVANKSSGINIWEYNVVDDTLFVISNSPRIKQNCYVIDNYIESTIANGYVREDSIPVFISIFDRLRAGVREVTEDIWYKTTDELGWWCERVTYTSYLDDGGKPIKAFGAGRDVTREKEAEKNFYDEMAYREAMHNTTLCSLKLNLTNNTIVDGKSPFSVVMNIVRNGNVDEYFAKTAQAITGDDIRSAYKRQFGRRALINSFNSGEYLVNMEITRYFDTNKIYWINYSAHLLKNAENGDLMAYIVCTDITHEKAMQTITDTVAKNDYDLFVIVDGNADSASDYAVTGSKKIFGENDSFERRNEELIRKNVVAEDIDRVIEECKINNVLNALKYETVHKFNFSMYVKGETRRKQMQVTLIDKERKTFLMTRIDVNNIYLEQQSSKKKLEDALIAAEQASKVKSDFLARMSHDIRTPMNAILGLSRIALEEVKDEKTTVDSLTKIISSGEYLLGLLNDVLDLSKIESEKVVFYLEPYSSAECIDEIMTIVSGQIKAKNLEFEKNCNETSATVIMLDKLRFKQIWFNLISNAIKFTPEGGKIALSCKLIKRDGDKVTIEYRLKDNGIGMSEEFLEHIFEPFTQENSPQSTRLNGSGLGLPIVYNLIKLMNGDITVQSVLGVGTEFCITLKAQLAERENVTYCHTKHYEKVNLTGRRILLVEDHPLNTLVATKLLTKAGATVDNAENGKKAVEMFCESTIDFYDVILMDIRMPVMDGLTATELIRSCGRQDSLKVPIIAMTANAFYEDINKSLEAGMNAHLAKPIDTQKLYDTIQSFLQGRKKGDNTDG